MEYVDYVNGRAKAEAEYNCRNIHGPVYERYVGCTD